MKVYIAGKITHWMPLPEAPEVNGIKIRESFKF